MGAPVPYYQADGITIYCGDCREVLPHVKADVVVTDPPYGLGERWQGGTWGAHPMYADARAWDRETFAGLVELVAGFGAAIVWGGNYYRMPPSRCWLSWVKVPPMQTMADFELAWTSFDRPSKAWTGTRNKDGQRQHPTQKPVGLMRWCLDLAPPGTIVDPFMGSGTTLVAAKQLGRQAIGIEIEERYCEIAVKRLAQTELFAAPTATAKAEQLALVKP